MPLKRKPPPGNVRRVASISNNLRYTLTNKTGRIVQCESYLERKLALTFERDVTVVDYMSQPERFTWQDDSGRERQYVPDFKVWRAEGHIEIHEVTLTSRHEQRQEREQAARLICDRRQWHYHIHTEATLPDDTYMLNLLALYPFRVRAYRQMGVSQFTLDYLKAEPQPVTMLMRYLCGATGQAPAQLYPGLYHDLWHGVLAADFNTLLFEAGQLQPTTMIRDGGLRHA